MPARAALLAVLAARNAAIEGDHATVDTFARDILGIARPELCRDGVITALLGDWVHHLGNYLTDPELLRILHQYTAAERRRWQPLWERRANGGRVMLTGVTLADGITLDDVLPDHRMTEDLALHHQLDDERLRTVLRGLTADEAAVAARWAQGAGTWTESALDADLPAAYGERVRRKSTASAPARPNARRRWPGERNPVRHRPRVPRRPHHSPRSHRRRSRPACTPLQVKVLTA